MSTVAQVEQSSAEERVFPLDFSPQLLQNATVQSCAVTHTPPSGNAVTVTAVLSNGIVYVPIPSGLVVGVHKFSCVATTSDAALSPEILLVVTVMR